MQIVNSRELWWPLSSGELSTETLAGRNVQGALKKQLWAGHQTFIMWWLFTVLAKRKTTICDFYFRASYELILKILRIVPSSLFICEVTTLTTGLSRAEYENQTKIFKLIYHIIIWQNSRAELKLARVEVNRSFHRGHSQVLTVRKAQVWMMAEFHFTASVSV